MLLKFNKSIIICLVLLFVVAPSKAQIRLLLYPDFIEVKENAADKWHGIKYSTKFYSGSIRLKSKAYLLFVDAYGKFGEIDTSGVLDIGMLENFAWKVRKDTTINSILWEELKNMDGKSMPLLSFDRAVERCRCMGSITIMGSNSKTYITKEGGRVFWNGDYKDKKYRMEILNYFDEVLEGREINLNEPLSIGSSIYTHLRQNNNLLLISIGFEDESERISISLIPEELYKQYEKDCMYIKKVSKNHHTIMASIVDFILLDKYELYLNSAETFYSIYDTLSKKYEDAYDKFFYKIQKQSFSASFLISLVNKNSIEIKINQGQSIPMLEEEVLLKSYVRKMEYEVGRAKVVKVIGRTVTLEFTKIYTSFFMENNEIKPGIFDNTKGTIVWKR